MGFFEKPGWCSSKHKDDCSGIKEHPSSMIPLSKLPYIDTIYFSILESLILLVLTCFKLFKIKFQKASRK